MKKYHRCLGEGLTGICLTVLLSLSYAQAGYWGGALKFDGTNSFARVPVFTNAPTGNAPYTQEFWMKINGWPVYATGINGFMLSRGSEGTALGNHMILWNQHLGVTHWNPDSDTLVPVQAGQWYHFAATWDGSTERVYLNGLLVWSHAWSAFNVAGGSVTFGQHDNVGGYRFQGELDEVRIWDHARSAETIRANFRCQVPPNSPGLLAYWQFDEETGQTLTDASAAQNHGYLGNADTADAADPARVLSTVPVSFGNGLLVGYSQVASFGPLTSAQALKLQQVSWYFPHASVGSNMVDGLLDLRADSPAAYPLLPITAGPTPPSPPQLGIVYEFPRGNPNWRVKVDDLNTYVATNGWRDPVANLVLNKLCFIDPDADVNYYIRSQSRLEAAFPTTLFIYATMPLTPWEDSYNHMRNVFNDAVREWAAANNKILFDIADLEAHDPSGTVQTFTYNSKVCQKLYSGFSTDGGHLDDAARVGRRQVAKGFYALAASLMQIDRDRDGTSDFDEIIAGTDPLSDSPGVVVSLSPLATMNQAIISWPSVSNRVYQLEEASAPDGAWEKQGADMPATPPVNRSTNTLSSGSRFYRLGVRR